MGKVMNIDMFWIWFTVIILTFAFQNHFTEKKSTWEVSYTYTTEKMEYIAYGQMSLTGPGTSIPWLAVKKYIAKNKTESSETGEEAIVVILAVHKEYDIRIFSPPWKHITWYE